MYQKRELGCVWLLRKWEKGNENENWSYVNQNMFLNEIISFSLLSLIFHQGRIQAMPGVGPAHTNFFSFFFHIAFFFVGVRPHLAHPNPV